MPWPNRLILPCRLRDEFPTSERNHRLQYGNDFHLDLWVDRAKPFQEAVFVDRSDLVRYDMTLLFSETA